MIVLLSFLGLVQVQAQAGKVVSEPKLRPSLERCYKTWRKAMLRRDFKSWASVTAMHKRVSVQNRLLSEQRAFPASIFDVPVDPPSLERLKPLRIRRNGKTASAVYFGKVAFGRGGKPTDNLLVLHFVHESRAWKYSAADFINLSALPKVRKQLKQGDLSYVDKGSFLPSGKVPEIAPVVGKAKYIAKVYVFCPGREVDVKVNGVSQHHFANTKLAEVVIGGGRDGKNSISFSTKSLNGATGKEALAIRVYLMSTVQGVQPVKVYEYRVDEGGTVKASASDTFTIDAQSIKKLYGKTQ